MSTDEILSKLDEIISKIEDNMIPDVAEISGTCCFGDQRSNEGSGSFNNYASIACPDGKQITNLKITFTTASYSSTVYDTLNIRKNLYNGATIATFNSSNRAQINHEYSYDIDDHPSSIYFVLTDYPGLGAMLTFNYSITLVNL